MTNPTREAEAVARVRALHDNAVIINGRICVPRADLGTLLAAVETLTRDVQVAKARHSDEAEAHEHTRRERARLRATLDALRAGVEGMRRTHPSVECPSCTEIHSCTKGQRAMAHNAALALVLTLLDRARDGE